MSALVTADLHFTEKPNDEYRWALFPFLKTKAKELGCKRVLFLGDLTDAKDHHSSVLVNRIVMELAGLVREGIRVTVSLGNHDGFDLSKPFFDFVHFVPGVDFVSSPEALPLWGSKMGLFLPCTRDVHSWPVDTFNDYEYIFTHQTYDGAQSENGTLLPGISPTIFDGFKGKVFSGDIHVPQLVNKKIEYVGAPYRIHFGDRFTPRVLHIGTNKAGKHQQQDLHLNGVQRVLVELRRPSSAKDAIKMLEQAEKDEDIYKGDQVKVRVYLARADYDLWPDMRKAIKDECTAVGWQLFGPELKAAAPAPKRIRLEDTGTLRDLVKKPEEIVRTHAKRHNLTRELEDIGMSLIS